MQTSVIVLENVAYDTDNLKKTFQCHTRIESDQGKSIIEKPGGAMLKQAQNLKLIYPYLLYLPTEYSSSKKDFPLIIYLGDGSQRGNDLKMYKRIKGADYQGLRFRLFIRKYYSESAGIGKSFSFSLYEIFSYIMITFASKTYHLEIIIINSTKKIYGT